MFAKLAQKNVDHYNVHPLTHTAICIGYGVVAGYVMNKILIKIANPDGTNRW